MTLSQDIVEIIAIAKNVAYIPAVFVAASGLSAESYFILATLMVVDAIFGMIRVGVVHGGTQIKSYKLRAGVLTKATVLAVPAVLAWAGRGAGIDLTYIAQGAVGLLILAETYSIIGNVYSIRIGRDVQEFDAVSWVLRRVQSFVEKLIKEEESRAPTTERGVACKIKEGGRTLEDASKN